MSAMHEITSRPPTARERRIIEASTRPDIASYGCIVMFFGIGFSLLLGWLGGRIGSFHSEDAATFGRWIGWTLAAAIFVYVLVSFASLERRLRRRASKDARALAVQEVSVSDPRLVEIYPINDNEPILAFDIGQGKLLFLQGQWLRDPVTYGAEEAEELEDDACDDFLNGLPAPHSFPSSKFTVTRLPNSGRVLGISVEGEYLSPEVAVEALKREYEFGDSEILLGELDDIAGVLAREHAVKVAK
jgi:hypothetical protein